MKRTKVYRPRRGLHFSDDPGPSRPKGYYVGSAAVTRTRQTQAKKSWVTRRPDSLTITGGVMRYAAAAAGALLLRAGYNPLNIPVDPTSGWFMPESTIQWNLLLAGTGIPAPDHIWLCQETAGNLADSVGTNSAVPNAGVAYAQPVSGWTRKGVLFHDASGDLVTVANLPNCNANSSFSMLLTSIGAAPAATRTIEYMGGTDAEWRTTGQLAATQVGTIVGNALDANTVRVVGANIDQTNTKFTVYSDNGDVMSPTWAAPNSATSWFWGAAVGTAPAMTVMYAARWEVALTAIQVEILYNRLQYGPATVTADKTSGWRVPMSAAEWTTMLAGSGIPNPNDAWTYQDYPSTSGPFADVVGSNVMSNVSSTPRIAVTGWSRVGAGSTTDSGGEGISSTAIGDSQTESIMHLVLVNISTAPSVNHDIHGVGLNVGYRGSLITPAQKLAMATLDGSNAPVGTVVYPLNAVIPIVIRIDRTNGNCCIITDKEKIAQSPYTAPNGATTGLTLGAASTQACAFQVVYGAFWKGASAEMTDNQVSTLISLIRNGH